MEKILIAGGSGLVGSRLNRMLLSKGYETIILTRKLPEQQGQKDSHTSYALWDIEKGTIDKEALARADYIINLAGAAVAEQRWTAARKQEIINSRVKSCDLLVKALRETDNKVKTVLCASAAGYYGADKSGPVFKGFTETDPPATDFLGETCRLWEESIDPVTSLDKRLVKFRIGIVLSNEGGALVEFKKPLKFGLATILGSGNQIISWVHIEDLCRLMIHALENEALSGVYNAVAPTPVSNKTLIKTLAQVREKFYIPVPVPVFALKIAMGEMSAEVLKSATVSAAKTESTGFRFLFPDVKTALEGLRKEEVRN
jgi:uncharacterized protein (TIGR01777 family)